MKAILIKNSDTFDGGWVRCPSCRVIFFVSFATVGRTSCDIVCGCGQMLTVPIVRNVIIDLVDGTSMIASDRIMPEGTGENR